MNEIKFTSAQKELLIHKLQQYFSTELEQDLAQFDADFLLDFFTKEMGNHFYNQGIYDAQQLLAEKLDDITDEMFQLEKPAN
ncbi:MULTISPECIES: DUF2164 domain-containing protein [unclassified Colwellia]|uniref:DUF2164 domain-containing protein n=1 Tax=unclassified Colwellia TaxID=196834 RepID=UPI0015F5C517|nr:MULTISPECIES: DUF2164 domain-containing protein [unclassified Colwellia]MBA6233215.1 DUF2164 domain-containing protein [Colwellia sp. MB02u-7]MBA6236305.1 DUF2164 domain-containing protein [Colwellia sp. MB02u-11]MBA6298295.1 DUF2164 domain-containing protein [Colwellia sp. MB3u-22]MBA6304032.1 DUF2164 domain-containing protein [Colwellia sp. MB02u-14]MBA6311880.1 DUF2164 domain-containing protein [Colwellia sp. MB3u-64]